MDPANALLWLRRYLHQHLGLPDSVGDYSHHRARDDLEPVEIQAVRWWFWTLLKLVDGACQDVHYRLFFSIWLEISVMEYIGVGVMVS